MNFKVPCIYGKTKNRKVEISVGGSKSVCARALVAAALASGESTLYNISFCDDIKTFINCLTALGVECNLDGTTLKVIGCGGIISKRECGINVGSAGTAARFLTALLAFQNGKYTLDCSPQMKSRPISPLINSLKTAGAKFTFLEKADSFPFIIESQNLSQNFEINVDKSSQYLSALLLAAPCTKKPVKIKVVGAHGRSYVDMTLDVMWSFGVNVEERWDTYAVDGAYSPKKYDIEPDISSACYFYAMNKILGTNISVRGVMPHSMQGDIKFIALLKDFNGGAVDMSGFSDQFLTLAAIAPYLDSPTEICNIAHVRGQECDRISAAAYNLKQMGVECEERADGIKIYPAKPNPAKIKTFGDHRVAMAFALTGLRQDGIEIENAEVCNKTFPRYFDVLKSLIGEIT